MKSNKYAILIGINRYHESLGQLKYAVNDCRCVASVLTEGPDGFPPDHVLLITDDQPEDRRPTYANIHSWLASYLAQAQDDDTVLVYFAGHGREHGGKAYLLPGDATLQTVHVTGIPVGYVQELLGRCKARQKLLVLDACHSGAGRDVVAMSGSMMDQIAAGKGVYTITSCDADELSHEWDEKKQGVFSYYFAEALSGTCPPDSQGRITAESLYEWVYDRVRSWAASKRCSQTPKRFAEGTGAVVLGRARKDYQPKPEPEMAPPRPALPVWRAATGAVASIMEAVRTARKSTAAFLKTKGGKTAVIWTSVCIAVVALVVWIAADISAKNREDRRVLAEAQIAVNAGKPADALRLLASREMLARNRAEQDQLKTAATRLQHLEAAERAAEAGDVPRVAELTARYTGDAAFKAAMTKALDVGEEKYTGLVTGYINKGDYLAAATACTYYAGRQPFDGIMEQARQLALEHIRRVSLKGDWEAARKATEAFPRDEELAELGKEAKRIFDRPRLLQESNQAASLGHVEQVQAISSAYPDDQEFAGLVSKARQVWSNDLALAEMAAREGNTESGVFLSKKHIGAKEFAEFAAQARQVRRTRDLGIVRTALGSNDFVGAMAMTETWTSDREFKVLRQEIFKSVIPALPRLHQSNEKPQPLRCEATGRVYNGLYENFRSHHGQCPVCGRWVLIDYDGPWNQEFGCCAFCARAVPIGQLSEVNSCVTVRRSGETPPFPACEVTGRRYTGLSENFTRCHAQCRLCGRWVFVGDGNTTAWSYDLACCRPCADAALVYRERHGLSLSSENKGVEKR